MLNSKYSLQCSHYSLLLYYYTGIITDLGWFNVLQTKFTNQPTNICCMLRISHFGHLKSIFTSTTYHRFACNMTDAQLTTKFYLLQVIWRLRCGTVKCLSLESITKAVYFFFKATLFWQIHHYFVVKYVQISREWISHRNFSQLKAL